MLLGDLDAATIGAWTGLVTAVGGIAMAIIKLWRRDDVTDRRVDLLWQANLRRGAVESSNSLKTEKGDSMSPLGMTTKTLRPDVVAAYKPLAPYLQKLRRDNPGISRVQFAEILEHEHGEWLMRHICTPLNVSSYACHDAAWEVSEMRPSEVVRTAEQAAPPAP